MEQGYRGDAAAGTQSLPRRLTCFEQADDGFLGVRKSAYLPRDERVEELFCYAVFRLVQLRAYRMHNREEVVSLIVIADEFQNGDVLRSEFPDARSCRKRTRYLFTPHTLEYLRRGGRIGGASALIGGLLQIKPILTVERGETQTFAKVRTQSRALAEMTKKLADDVAAYGLKQVIVHYIADRELAEAYAREQIEPLGDLKTQTFSEVWEGFGYRVVRQLMHPPELAMCRRCDDFLDDNRRYLELINEDAGAVTPANLSC